MHRLVFTIFILKALCLIAAEAVSNGQCSGISEEVGCTECTSGGYCMAGKVPVDPWFSFAAKTQRELQIDEPWNNLQLLDAHNAYNARVFGYGNNDTCNWPPPYDNNFCWTFANQVFSLTDLLNMGIRGLEIDFWWCADGAMRMAHLANGVGCRPTDRLYSDGIKEIGDWLNQPGNQQDMLRIYLNEKEDQGHDDEVHGPLEEFLGDRILTPSELRDEYGGVWPTMKHMRKVGKNIVIAASGEAYTHGDVYIHRRYWKDVGVNSFTNYPGCGVKNATNTLRYFSDGTHYGPFYDGVTDTGIILDFTEFVKCRVEYPATDFITPDVVKTAIFTWAEGQPSEPLDADSCVWISKTDWRWYLSDDCSIELYHACQSLNDPDDWTISSSPGPYRPITAECPTGYAFSVPQDGYRTQKLRESSGGNSLWLNYTPWLPEPVGSTAPSSNVSTCLSSLLFLATLGVVKMLIE
ncbi:uncharacterized protein LOC119737024 [Patiria miniata]|uniref:PLC-like phosphodiesterase n=1 Tax=Patiria miniata TaxID=46514 RepID=A0A914ATC0_PATMI|nr:uncharacterized protein LOC119737024 [Patiria miniata]